MTQANTMYSKDIKVSMSTSNKAHLHRSINAEAKANEHNTIDMTYKGIQSREHTCHISQSRRYHYLIDIIVCMKVNTRMHKSSSVSHK